MMKLLQLVILVHQDGRNNCIDLGFCTKKKFLPEMRHGGYDACRSVHAEQNAIISASRKDMIDSELYLVGIRKDTGEYEVAADSCQLCKKMIINAGIKRVFVKNESYSRGYKVIDVQEWIENDELLRGKITY